MSETQRQIIQECFDGDRERDCDYCPAHCSKNGKCCFSAEFDEDDQRCASCNHNYHCSLETAQKQERERTVDRPRRIMINRGDRSSSSRLPVFGQHRNEHQNPRPQYRNNNSLIPPSERIMRHVGDHGEVQPMASADGFWKNMGLHAAWGAGEGLVEMLLSYLRNRRPL